MGQSARFSPWNGFATGQNGNATVFGLQRFRSTLQRFRSTLQRFRSTLDHCLDPGGDIPAF
jgi:hypothetical protein